jgi:hypothetical protein
VRDRALDYFANDVTRSDASWGYLLPYLSRRYGVTVALADGDSQAATPPGYERLVDPYATTSRADIAALASPVDRILTTALHCDRLGVPDGWLTTLSDASDRGGYALTHAVLATGWTVENGCLSSVDTGPLRARQRETLLQLIDSLDDLARSDERAADVWLEALALLAYLPGGGEAPRAARERLLVLQQADGGWPEHPDATRSSPHASAFALWALLEWLDAAVDAPHAMIPR